VSKRTSLPIIGVLVVSVLGAGLTRHWCVTQRERLDASRGIGATTSTANLSKLNSFALGLLLGGLRGPLVMALWTSSENQKSERNLDDFDTKVELIRMLQPEFDTVHLFQIWNKAYNISVQVTNVPNKYTTILDAVDYGFKVDTERPDNINVLSAIGGLYFDKFGGAAEAGYFSPRLRDETLSPQDRVRVSFPVGDKAGVLRAARLAGASTYALVTREATSDSSQLSFTLPASVATAFKKIYPDAQKLTYEDRPVLTADRRASAGRRTQHDVLLDANFKLLPRYTQPLGGRAATGDGADGSEMPYLKEYEPFPLGVSPYAIGYNYYRRAEWLQTNREMRHAQLSDRVMSSRPALALRKWHEEDWRAARRSEIELAGRTAPREDSQLEAVTQDVLLDTALPTDTPLFAETIARYERSTQVGRRAASAYAEHIKRFPEDELTYRSHIKNVLAQTALVNADALYLHAVRATGAERQRYVEAARAAYVDAANQFTRHIFRYFMEDADVEKVLPRDVLMLKRTDADSENSKLRDDQLAPALTRLRAIHQAGSNQLSSSEDFVEMDSNVQRCYARLRNLAVAK